MMVTIAKLIDEMEKDVKRVKEHLKNLDTKEFISVTNWDSKTDDDKKRIFKQYNDFRNIDEFYKQLKNRQDSLNEADITKLSEINRLCCDKANMLTSINGMTSNGSAVKVTVQIVKLFGTRRRVLFWDYL